MSRGSSIKQVRLVGSQSRARQICLHQVHRLRQQVERARFARMLLAARKHPADEVADPLAVAGLRVLVTPRGLGRRAGHRRRIHADGDGADLVALRLPGGVSVEVTGVSGASMTGIQSRNACSAMLKLREPRAIVAAAG
jgi:hypothetical protein